MDETTSSQPHADLRALDRLIGTWRVAGDDVAGEVRFAWMEGGFFLLQHVDLLHGGRAIKGVEYIGYDADSQTLKSHYFDSTGSLFEYVWEVDAAALRIWGGYVGSPAAYTGTWSADGNTNAGAWAWPGGGYASTMTRVS